MKEYMEALQILQDKGKLKVYYWDSINRDRLMCLLDVMQVKYYEFSIEDGIKIELEEDN